MQAGLTALLLTLIDLAHFGPRASTTRPTSPSTSTPTSTPTPTPTPTSTSTPTPTFTPSQLRLTGPLTGETLTETESCAGCHADAAAQWQSSAHAFASFNNPVYRVAVDRFRATVGRDASRF